MLELSLHQGGFIRWCSCPEAATTDAPWFRGMIWSAGLSHPLFASSFIVHSRAGRSFVRRDFWTNDRRVILTSRPWQARNTRLSQPGTVAFFSALVGVKRQPLVSVSFSYRTVHHKNITCTVHHYNLIVHHFAFEWILSWA